MQPLKQSTAFTVIVGPILDSAGAEYTGAVIGDLSISKNGTEAAMAAAATLTHVSNGHYTLVGTTGNTDTLGRLDIRCNKSTYQMPPLRYEVLQATVFDALVTNAAGGANGLLLSLASNQVDVGKWLGTAVSTPTVAGVPNVNAKTWNDLATVALPLVPTVAGRTLDVTATGEAGIDWANIGGPTTAVNLSGTTVKTATDVETDTQDIQGRLPAALGANGNIKADVRDFSGTAGTFSGGRPEVNASHWGGTAVASANVRADLRQIIGTTLTETTGANLAGCFSEWFDENPTTCGTSASVPRALPAANGGLPTADASNRVKADLDTIKTQTVTCAAGVTVSPFVGNATAAIVVDASGNANADVKEINNSTTTVTNFAIVFNTDFATNYSTTTDKWQVEAAVTSIANNAITAAAMADGAIDNATLAVDTGLRTTRSSTLQSATAGAAVLDAAASATNDLYTGLWLKIIASTGAGQVRLITAYNGTSKSATITPNWATTPDNTSQFAILPAGTIVWNAAWDAEVESEATDALNAYDPPTHAELTAGLGTADDATLAAIATAQASIDDLPTNAELATALGTADDAVLAAVSTLQTSVNDVPTNAELATALGTADDAVLAAIAALTIPTTGQITTAVWTTALTEAYRATGATGTGAQLMYEILGNLINFANAGTTRTVTKLDKSTTAKTYTYDDGTNPTASEETT